MKKQSRYTPEYDQEIKALIEEANKPFDEKLDEHLEQYLKNITNNKEKKELIALVEKLKKDWKAGEPEREKELAQSQAELKEFFVNHSKMQSEFFEKLKLRLSIIIFAIFMSVVLAVIYENL